MEEVAREHGRCLRTQELPPGRLAALRRWRYPQPFQHPAHRGRPDADAETEQFAPDPLVAPERFSRAICSISTASRASTGGRPPVWR
jgi:hypothetical protein